MPSSAPSNSATRCSEGDVPGTRDESALLSLHAADSAQALALALTDVLRDVGLPGRWTIVFRSVLDAGTARVFTSSLSRVRPGTVLGLPVDLARERLLAGGEALDVPVLAGGSAGGAAHAGPGTARKAVPGEARGAEAADAQDAVPGASDAQDAVPGGSARDVPGEPRTGAATAGDAGAGPPLKCFGVLPLTFGHNHYGALLLHDVAGERERQPLARIREHLGVALYMRQAAEERGRLHDLDTRKLGLMMQATSVVLRELDLERSLVKLAELTVNAIGGEVGCISLTSRDDLRGVRHASWGVEEAALAGMRLHDGRPLAALVVDGGMTCLFRNREELAELQDSEALSGISSLAALPVPAVRGVRGCLVVANAERIDRTEIELLRLATEVCSTAIDNALRHLDSLERESLREQLRLAGSIQQSLLPKQAPDVAGVELDGCNVPCDDSSGDYYDYFALDAHRVGFVVADATGHGIGAALIATTARAALRALLHQRRGSAQIDLGEVLAQLNALAESDMADDKFITLLIGLYDTRTRELTYASAGHDPPLMVMRRGAQRIEQLEATGLPLGMFAGTTYEEVTIAPLAVGDLLLLATDGVNEARNGAGEQFGMDRLHALLREAADLSATEVINRLIDEHQAFTELRPREDDITVICLRATA